MAGDESLIPAIDFVLVEKDGDAFHFLVQIGEQVLEVITNLELAGDLLIASDLHMEGPGAGRISALALRAAARKLALSWGANAIRIEGGIRTTGAAPGHRARPLTIDASGGRASP